VKTTELIGAALDWAVAAALNKQWKEDRVIKVGRQEATLPAWIERENHPGSVPHYHRFSPSTDRDQCMEIIEREFIAIFSVETRPFEGEWAAEQHRHQQLGQIDDMGNYGYSFYDSSLHRGPTACIAAMRCYVASQLGAEVQLPDQLLETTS
jgi:hypothetical protein